MTTITSAYQVGGGHVGRGAVDAKVHSSNDSPASLALSVPVEGTWQGVGRRIVKIFFGVISLT